MKSIVLILGQEAEIFLQGLLTEDVASVKDGGLFVSLMLNAKGRYLFHIIGFKKSKDEFLLALDNAEADEFLAKLIIYKLNTKVDLQKTELQFLYSFDSLAGLEGVAFSQKDIREKANGFVSFAKGFVKGAIRDDEYREYLFMLGIPEAKDLLQKKSIPLENGFDEGKGISFNKGCYLGQEFTNSCKRRLNITKKLIYIELKEQCLNINIGDEILNKKNEKVGKVQSILNNDKILVLIDFKLSIEEMFLHNIKIK